MLLEHVFIVNIKDYSLAFLSHLIILLNYINIIARNSDVPLAAEN